MNPLTLEWTEKAEGDMDTALREDRARLRPNKGLDGYAVRVRYPGQKASKEEARIAIKIAKVVQTFVHSKLNL
jgi:hypothetical protein